MEISRTNMSISNAIDTCFVDLDEALKKARSHNSEACSFYDLSDQSDKEYIEFIISTLTKNHYTHYNEFIYRTRSSLNSIKSSTCIPFDYKLDITADGYLFPCERTEYQYPLGRVVDKKLVVDYDKLAEDYTRIFSHYEKQCSTCIHKYSCKYCLYCEKNFHKSNSKCSKYQEIDIQNVIQMIDFLKKNPEVFKRSLLNE